MTGETRSWCQQTEQRHFCANCGSRLFGTDDHDPDEIGVRLGCFDEAPTDLTPVYELLTKRRERWLSEVSSASQHRGNRT